MNTTEVRVKHCTCTSDKPKHRIVEGVLLKFADGSYAKAETATALKDSDEAGRD